MIDFRFDIEVVGERVLLNLSNGMAVCLDISKEEATALAATIEDVVGGRPTPIKNPMVFQARGEA